MSLCGSLPVYFHKSFHHKTGHCSLNCSLNLSPLQRTHIKNHCAHITNMISSKEWIPVKYCSSQACFMALIMMNTVDWAPQHICCVRDSVRLNIYACVKRLWNTAISCRSELPLEINFHFSAKNSYGSAIILYFHICVGYSQNFFSVYGHDINHDVNTN